MSNHKKLIAIIGVVAVAGGFMLFSYPEMARQATIKTIEDVIIIDGVEKEIAYMGDTDKNLIIKSDFKDYYNWGGSVYVYFSITNVSGDNQNVRTLLAFGDHDKFKWHSVERFVRNDEIVIPKSSYVSATTGEIVIVPAETKIKTIWENKKITLKEVIDSKFNSVRDDLHGRTHIEQFKNLIKAGETAYYRALVSWPSDVQNEEFIFEAFGEKEYGYLDPNAWTYEELFNDLNTAPLVGQDSWAGDDAWCVITTTTPHEGTKHIHMAAGASDLNNTRTITSIANGTVYISWKKNANNDGRITIRLLEGTSAAMTLDMTTNGTMRQWDNTGGAWITLGSYSADTYYRVGICFESGAGEWDCGGATSTLSADTYTVNVDDGNFIAAGGYENATDGIDKIEIRGMSDATSNYYYMDSISPDYTPTGTSDTCSCPDPAADWNVNSGDNCFLSTECYLKGKVLYLISTSDTGTFNIQNGGILTVGSLQTTSTPINLESGALLHFEP